jgi:hypothetical protein
MSYSVLIYCHVIRMETEKKLSKRKCSRLRFEVSAFILQVQMLTSASACFSVSLAGLHEGRIGETCTWTCGFAADFKGIYWLSKSDSHCA